MVKKANRWMQMWEERNKLTQCWLFCHLHFGFGMTPGQWENPMNSQGGNPKAPPQSSQHRARLGKGSKAATSFLAELSQITWGKKQPKNTRHSSGLSPATDGEEDEVVLVT